MGIFILIVVLFVIGGLCFFKGRADAGKVFFAFAIFYIIAMVFASVSGPFLDTSHDDYWEDHARYDIAMRYSGN